MSTLRLAQCCAAVLPARTAPARPVPTSPRLRAPLPCESRQQACQRPCMYTSSSRQVSLRALATPDVVEASPVQLGKQLEGVSKQLRDASKRMKKISKQLCKVPVHEKQTLVKELSFLNSSVAMYQAELQSLVAQMAAVGYEEVSSSDSSSDEREVDQVLPASEGGLQALRNMRKGTVTVCTGKACTRKGGAPLIEQTLQDAFATSSVAVTTCKCMGMCKQAANVRLDAPKAGPTIVCGMTATDVSAAYGMTVSPPEVAATKVLV